MTITFDQQRLNQICEDNDIQYLALFGSFATGEQRANSDVDLLVSFRHTKSLLEKGKVIVAFQELFKREVDLVSSKNVKPALRPYIEKQLIPLYGTN